MLNKKFFAEVKEVHSGDDLILLVDLGLDGLYKKVRGRLVGVDTPDAYKANATTEAGKVRDYVKGLVKSRRCYIDVSGERRNSWLITLFIEHDGRLCCLNKILIDRGFVYNAPNSSSNGGTDKCLDSATKQLSEILHQIQT